MDEPIEGLRKFQAQAVPKSWLKRGFEVFQPILAGATLVDRILGCAGALLGIGLTGLICGLAFGNGPHLPLLVAPMGASAVLLFAVPASPLAQPWSIIGGNTISALVGVAMLRLVPDPMIAAALAVALAMGAMSMLRCLHPPGGAAALTAVLGGPAVVASGYVFPLIPVGLNSTLLVLIGWLFHQISRRHTYPHRTPPTAVNVHGTSDVPSQNRVGFRPEDVNRALEDLGETFDIDRRDVDRLLRQVELRAFDRSHGSFRCSEIMSRDIISVRDSAAAEEARRLLLDHAVRTLPVLDDRDRVVGSVGIRELARPGVRIADIMSDASTTKQDIPAIELLQQLTDGSTHAVVVVDDRCALLGIVTKTDLLSALARIPQIFPRDPEICDLKRGV